MKKSTLMKKWMAVVVMLLLVLASGSVYGEKANNGALCLDVVIVLDQSQSMNKYGGKTGSDIKGYRLEAASIMLSMCDVNNSRAAIVPFHGELVEGGLFSNLMDISLTGTNANRRALINKLAAMNDDTGGDTNIGLALLTAVNLLSGKDYKDVGNHPAVLLLTDGEISFEPKSYRTEKESKALEDASYEKMQEAAQIAVENGIPIHVLALEGANAYSTSDIAAIAERTGGCFRIVNTAADLPEAFNAVFASQIGSSVVTLTGHTQQSSDKEYEVTVSIPNHSVAEVNVMIGTSSLKKSNKSAMVKLIDPDGKTVEADGVSIIREETNYFVFYKIAAPEKIGDWKFYLTAENGKTANDAAINVVFSYNVELSADLKRENLKKTDALDVQSFFVLKDGARSTDKAFYQAKNIGSFEVISCQYEICDENGKEVISGTMQTLEGEGFALNEVLKDLGISKSGQYTINITADGAGLLRSCSSVFTVENQMPYVKNAPSDIVLRIDDPIGKEKEAIAQIDLNAVFADDDGVCDTRAYRYEVVGNSELLDITLQDGIVTVKPRVFSLETIEENLSVEIYCEDAEGAYAKYSVPVTVHSLRNAFANQYTPEVVYDDVAAKCSQYEVNVYWKDQNGRNADAEIYNQTKVELKYSFAGKKEELVPFEHVEKNGDSVMTGVVTIPDEEGELGFANGMIYYGNHTVAFELAQLYVDNAAPEWIAGDELFDAGVVRIPYNGEIEEERISLNLRTCFFDYDDEVDNLTLAAFYKGADQETEVEIPMDDGVLILPVAEMDATTILEPKAGFVLRLCAEDDEGAQTYKEISIILHNELNLLIQLAILAVAVAIVGILLIKLIVLILKPRFGKELYIVTGLRGYISVSDNERRLPVKKKHLRLSDYLDNEYFSDCEVSYDMLAGIKLAPSGSRAVKVYVEKKKARKMGSMTVRLESRSSDEKILNKKGGKLHWECGNALLIQNNDGQVMQVILKKGGEEQNSYNDPYESYNTVYADENSDNSTEVF